MHSRTAVTMSSCEQVKTFFLVYGTIFACVELGGTLKSPWECQARHPCSRGWHWVMLHTLERSQCEAEARGRRPRGHQPCKS